MNEQQASRSHILKRVIIVDGNRDERDILSSYLSEVGFEAIGVDSADACSREVHSSLYALAILSFDLPDQSGAVLAEYVRKNTNMPIIMLIQGGTFAEKLAGYHSGADFCLSKPVDNRELLAVINNLLERWMPDAPALPASGMARVKSALNGTEENVHAPWILDRKKWLLISPDGSTIRLTSREFEFMNCLYGQDENAATRQQLLLALRYEMGEYGHRALAALVHRLRRKTTVAGYSPIRAVHGVGFCFTALLLGV